MREERLFNYSGIRHFFPGTIKPCEKRLKYLSESGTKGLCLKFHISCQTQVYVCLFPHMDVSKERVPGTSLT